MTLSEQINNDFTEALKNKDSEKLSVLRMLKSSIKNSEIALKKTLDDPEVVKILQREVKQRKDSIESFLSAGREQLAEKEKKEIKYLEKYLPEQLSDDDLTAILETVIVETGAKSMADLGKVMASAMSKVSGRADGSAVSEKAKELLTK
ncbi:MAG: GatB/YqeY domain-containing protein [Patescibacteria group bacterium]|nr:GatB/YqeY domain-containing protein [Patescibacteria group bacterium]